MVFFHNGSPDCKLQETKAVKPTNTVIEKITRALIGLNKQKLPAQIRLTLLDIYNEPVNLVLKALENDYLRTKYRTTKKKEVRAKRKITITKWSLEDV